MKRNLMIGLLILVTSMYLCPLHAQEGTPTVPKELTGDALYQAGLNLVQQEKYQEAIPYFEEAVKKKANFCEAYYQLGVCYLKTKEFDKAKSSLTLAKVLSQDKESKSKITALLDEIPKEIEKEKVRKNEENFRKEQLDKKEKMQEKEKIVQEETTKFLESASLKGILKLNAGRLYVGPNLPANDIEETYFELLKKIPPKSEFETTKEYRNRIQSYDFDKVYAFKKTSCDLDDFSYDADQNSLMINLHFRPLSNIRSPDYRFFLEIKGFDIKTTTYVGTNAFGAKVEVTEYSGTLYGIVPIDMESDFLPMKTLRIKMPPARAKEVLQNQSNIGMIIFCEPCVTYESIQPIAFEDYYHSKPTLENPAEFSYLLKCINVKNSMFVIYDTKTGEIFALVEGRRVK